jgi:hypothetical protein
MTFPLMLSLNSFPRPILLDIGPKTGCAVERDMLMLYLIETRFAKKRAFIGHGLISLASNYSTQQDLKMQRMPARYSHSHASIHPSFDITSASYSSSFILILPASFPMLDPYECPAHAPPSPLHHHYRHALDFLSSRCPI